MKTSTIRSLLAATLVLAGLAVSVPAQQASFVPFGIACAAPGEATPAIGAQGLPQLGTSFEVTYTGPNRTPGPGQLVIQPILVTGLGVLPAPFAIPAGLFTLQPAGCFVFVQPDLSTETPVARGGIVYESSVTLQVPNAPPLIGASWFHQWVVLGRQCGIVGCTMAWVMTSDAAQATAGF
jgi:hypothetical protein